MLTAGLSYRSYAIATEGDDFVAREAGQDEEIPLVIRSKDMNRLTRSIDELWDALESGTKPAWYKAWEDNPKRSVDLDSRFTAKASDFAVAMSGKVFATEPDVESVPSETDPPMTRKALLFTISAILVSSLMASGMQLAMAHVEPEIVFTLCVGLIAMLYGWRPAISTAIASMAIYNLVAIPPVLEFSIPSTSEIIYGLINVAVSLMVPLLVGEDKKKTSLLPKLGLA
jgi:K+-sensing histidine kinase KdpD